MFLWENREPPILSQNDTFKSAQNDTFKMAQNGAKLRVSFWCQFKSVILAKIISGWLSDENFSDLAENLGGSSEFQGLSNDTKLANSKNWEDIEIATRNRSNF